MQTTLIDYRPLYDYLRVRLARRVTMGFSDIETLIGTGLPAEARIDRLWWSGTDPFAHRAPHADAWMLADCRALVDLSAASVVFERLYAARARRR